MGTNGATGETRISQEISMVDFQELREGVSLGGYTLERSLQQDGAGSSFAVLTETGERLLMKLVPERGADAEQQFAIWQRSRLLRQTNLVDVRDVGRCELEGNGYFYSVFEYPDEVLAAALGHGPLSEAETREVLKAALAALRYLHGQGLVHGAVTPDHIVAVGETVKLATEGLRESGDPEGYAKDVRQFGELVRTLRAPEPLDEPLATVARHATTAEVRERWTLAEIANVLEPRPVESPKADELAKPIDSPRPVEAPKADEPVPALPAPRVRRDETEQPPRAFPKWIIAGVGLLLLFILFFNLQRKPETAEVRSAAAPPPAPAVTPTEPVAAPPVKSPPPPPPTAGPWRVIAFTYHSHELAAKKTKWINEKWPDLHAAVFAPKTLQGFYLVALGNGMSREEANRLQRKARSLGLPRDTFVQNYRE